MKYRTTIIQTGNNTGIHVPEDILSALGGGRRPLVSVTINGYTYRSAVGKMGEKFMIPLSAANRESARVNGGDTLVVSMQLDDKPRVIAVPVELQLALEKNRAAKKAFEKLSPSKQKAMALLVTEAKAQETKIKRIDKIVLALTKKSSS